MDHLLLHHRCTPHCPRCGATFEYHIDRGQHIAKRGCNLTDKPPVFEGLDEGTMHELKAMVLMWERYRERERDDSSVSLSLSKGEKFADMWKLLFYGEDFRSVMPGGVGESRQVRVVQAVRDYWSRNGAGLVAETFEEVVGKKMDLLMAEVLDGVLERVLLEEIHMARSEK